jgi:uncharacterized protein YbjT (DUF2867 family)
MRLLLTGANGFIGSRLLAGLVARGHTVVAAVRDTAGMQRKWPGIQAIAVNFNHDTSVETWRRRLAGIDAVINCAGVLHGGRGQDIEAIHAATPIALFDACLREDVRKVVQISAISADADVGTEYAATKKRADDHLRTLALDWTVLRPSLVYGEGSYGGTSTLRGLAGLPLVTPSIGDSAVFRPIHVDDLVETVARVVEGDGFARRTLEPVGPDILSMRDIVAKYRRWLGLPPAPAVPVPLPLLGVAAKLADLVGGGPMGSAGLRQALAGNAGHEAPGVFEAAMGFRPASMDEGLARRPAETQDLWHARLYFLRPALRLALAALWLGSGIAGLLASTERYAATAAALVKLGLPVYGLAIALSLLDLVLAVALLLRLYPRLIALVQLAVVLGYTLILGVLVPALWLDPFGALLKNLPILVVIAVWAVLEEER